MELNSCTMCEHFKPQLNYDGTCICYFNKYDNRCTFTKERVLNPDIVEFFVATCERYRNEKLRKD